MHNIRDIIYKLHKITRDDVGISGDGQFIEQMVWILFLKVLCEKGNIYGNINAKYALVIPCELSWNNWAKNSSLTGRELTHFIDNVLFPSLSNLDGYEKKDRCQYSISEFFSRAHNYMKDGCLLRNLIVFVDEIHIDSISKVYECLLEELRFTSALGAFYTPRAITDFIVKMVHLTAHDSVADFSFGTGEFLVSSANNMKAITSTDEFSGSVYGEDVSSNAYLLGVLNFLLHDIDISSIRCKDSIMPESEGKYDVVIMNPPMGKKVDKKDKSLFPVELVSGDSSDLFLTIAMDKLQKNGHAAVVLPEVFLKGTSGARLLVKKRLFSEYDVHTIIRIPTGALTPYTSVSLCILFFDNTHPTTKTWFYQIAPPENCTCFSKTKPVDSEHFKPVVQWWESRQAISAHGIDKVRSYSIEEISARNFNIDYCGENKQSALKIAPYKGNESYIFVSYSHKDKNQVLEVIDKLIKEGHRIWYDEGIDPGTEWDENIANHIENCDGFIAFISTNYINSDNCKDELNFARDLEKDRLLVYLEDVKLPAGMAMRLNRLQAIHSYTYSVGHDFFEKLKETPMLMRN